MKYLKDYTEQAQTDLFNELGVFFAFSMDQYNSQALKGVKYVSLGSGLIVPKENAKRLMKKLRKITDRGMKMDLKENGREGVIKRELLNHESFYTGEIDQAFAILKAYGIKMEEVLNVFNIMKLKSV